MKRALVFLAAVVAFVACSTKHDAQKAVDAYFELIKKGNFETAWEMVDKESKEQVDQQLWINDVEKIKSLSMFMAFPPIQLNKTDTKAVIPTQFTGQKASMNQVPDAQIKFYAVKNGEKWEINLHERLEEIKKQKAYEAIEIPVDQTLIDTANKYKDKIIVENVRNGAVQYENGLEQYMMDATITNKTDKPLSYIGVNVKFMDDTNTKILFQKIFFLVYTRQIQGIYPLKPGEKRDLIIPGYDANDIDGNWTGKLQWEVAAVRIATPEELIELD